MIGTEKNLTLIERVVIASVRFVGRARPVCLDDKGRDVLIPRPREDPACPRRVLPRRQRPGSDRKDPLPG